MTKEQGQKSKDNDASAFFADYQHITLKNHIFFKRFDGKKSHFFDGKSLLLYSMANGINDVCHVFVADHWARWKAHADLKQRELL